MPGTPRSRPEGPLCSCNLCQPPGVCVQRGRGFGAGVSPATGGHGYPYCSPLLVGRLLHYHLVTLQGLAMEYKEAFEIQ